MKETVRSLPLTPKERRCLEGSPLFCGLGEQEMDEALALLEGRLVRHKKGALIRRSLAPAVDFGLLLSGSVQVYRAERDGEPLMMASVVPGESFGESMAYLGTEESPVYIVAGADCTVLHLKAGVLKSLSSASSPALFRLERRFVSLLAKRTLEMNRRIRLLSQKTVRGRIMTFLLFCRRQYGSNTFTLPMNREELAVYLGVNRSALSRELSHLREEGSISYYRSTFRLLREKNENNS